MFMYFVAMVDRQFSQTIQIAQSDNDTEFNCILDHFISKIVCGDT